MKIISGNSNVLLAQSIAQHLKVDLCQAHIKRFSDEEVSVEILESVRGEDVFIVQSTSYPANDHLMELLVTTDAVRRGSARRITAVIPYFGYARQDRKTAPRSPISAKLVANLLTVAGVSRVLTLDLHAGQIQGFFDIPSDNLQAESFFATDIATRFNPDNLVIVSPDVGGVFRARKLAKRLNAALAIIDKRREQAGLSEVMNVIGDVENKDCILVDDIVDSAGTLCNAAVALIEKGAATVSAYVTHGVLSRQAISRVEKSPLAILCITDSIAPRPDFVSSAKIRPLSVAPLLSDAMYRIHHEQSVSVLFS